MMPGTMHAVQLRDPMDHPRFNPMAQAPPQVQVPTRRPTPPITSFAQLDQFGRPRGNSSSTVGRSSTASWESISTRSPASSRTSFSSTDSREPSTGPPRRPEGAIQRPTRLKHQRRRREPGEVFETLPGEVLELILAHLRSLHLATASVSCSTCMMRDLCSASLTSRKWLKPARTILYQDIELVGVESAALKKRYKLNHGTRLKLLRRTIRANPELAALVKTLKPPAAPPEMPLEKYQNIVASVIMACPNFERLVGFHQKYDHSFNRLFQALSTREHLREMLWVIDDSLPWQQRPLTRSNSNGAMGQLNSPPPDLDDEQSENFFGLHVNWAQLTTLRIHCLPGATLTPITLLGDTMANLPSLRHLHLSHLPDTAFNDLNLLSLPALDSLTLSNIDGITTAGLATFARRPSSQSIRKLTLAHVDVDSVPVLGRIFSHLTQLESFSLVQEVAPLLPADEVIWLFPYLAASKLRMLHWDIVGSGDSANVADSILAKSIAAGGFPSLRRLRCPNDPDGVFQALCCPVSQIELPADKYDAADYMTSLQKQQQGQRKPSMGVMSMILPESPITPTTPRTPTGGFSAALKSPFGFKFPAEPEDVFVDEPGSMLSSGDARGKRGSHLAVARQAAQVRLEAAREKPRCTVWVWECSEIPEYTGQIRSSEEMKKKKEQDKELVKLADTFGIGGYMGEARSQIEYYLHSDWASDENGGLVELTDLVTRDGGEDLSPVAAGGNSGSGSWGGGSGSGGTAGTGLYNSEREGCIGRWNASAYGPTSDRKEKERWWHTERGRWDMPRLS